MNVFAKANRGYICSSCTHDNSDMSLARINEVSEKMVLPFRPVFFLFFNDLMREALIFPKSK